MSGTAPPPAVHLGLMTPTTGVASLYGDEIARAARISAARINAAGGILGRPLELVVADDGSQPESAVAAAQQLVDDGCVALVGNLMSNARLAVVESVAHPQSIPLLNFSFYEGSIASPWFFNFAALPNQQIELMIPYMAEHVGPRMYFAGSNYEWPRGSISAAIESLTAAGGEVVGEDYAPIGVSADDCDVILRRMASAGADVFVPYFAGRDQVLLLTRLQELGLHDRVGVLMGHFDEVMASRLTADARAGLYAANSYYMTVPTRTNRRLLADLLLYPGVTGIWPDGNGVISHFAEGAHACVTAFAAAAAATEHADRDEVCRALATVAIEAAQGPMLMDPVTQHAHVNAYLARCEHTGRFRLLESFGRIAPSMPTRYREEPVPSPRRDVGRRQWDEGIRRDLGAEAFHRTAAAVLLADRSGHIIEVNATAAHLFGYEPQELAGRRVESLMPPHRRESHRSRLQDLAGSDVPADAMEMHGPTYGYRKDGTYFPLAITADALVGADEPTYVVTMRDMSEIMRVQSSLRHAATHDELTGLPNRAAITERIEHSIERLADGRSALGVILIDVDSFKSVNDTFGHEAGDHVLRHVATRLAQTVRPGDGVARLAGDQFLVVADRLRLPEDLSQLAQRLVRSIAGPIEWGATTIRVTASAGLAVGSGSDDAARLVNQAELAMRHVKTRNCAGWEYYSATLHEAAQRRQQLSQHLRTAVDNDEFYAHYQPVLRLGDGRIVAAELLTRWNSPLGPVSPVEFIPIAEGTGSIHTLGGWVIDQAAQTLSRWHGQWGAESPRVFINVSPHQLALPSFTEDLLHQVRAGGAEAGGLVVELTESDLMRDVSRAAEAVADLAAHGIPVAVDDFGTGYSSLAELTSLPVRLIKIDRSFVSAAARDSRSARVLRAVIDLGRTLNLDTVAEGVETRAEADLVRQFGCQYAQGFYFGAPMSRGEIEDAISHQLSGWTLSRSDLPGQREPRPAQWPVQALDDAC